MGPTKKKEKKKLTGLYKKVCGALIRRGAADRPKKNYPDRTGLKKTQKARV